MVTLAIAKVYVHQQCIIIYTFLLLELVRYFRLIYPVTSILFQELVFRFLIYPRRKSSKDGPEYMALHITKLQIDYFLKYE
jgi:hypothetical protein